MQDLSSLTGDGTLRRKHRILTTGPSGKSLGRILKRNKIFDHNVNAYQELRFCPEGRHLNCMHLERTPAVIYVGFQCMTKPNTIL